MDNSSTRGGESDGDNFFERIEQQAGQLLGSLQTVDEQSIASLRRDLPDRALAVADILLAVLQPLLDAEAKLRGTSRAKLHQPHSHITYREARGGGVVIGGQTAQKK